MRTQNRFILALVFAMIAVCTILSVRWSSRPSIRVTHPVIDLGVVQIGEIHYRSFEIENFGDRAVTVIGDSMPCPGAIELHEPLVISGGAKGRVTIGLYIRETARADSPHTYRYTISTDDPDVRHMELQLVAHCKLE